MFNFKISDYANAKARVEIVANDWLPLPAKARSSRAASGSVLANPLATAIAPDKEQRETIVAYLEPVAELLDRLEFQASQDRLTSIIRKLENFSGPFHLDEIRTHCRILDETMREASQRARFYYYPTAKADVLQNMDALWSPVFKAFRSAEIEIRAGVDLWALGHSTASVFHLLRAAELALRALARERKVSLGKKPMEWGTWGSLLDALDVKILEVRRKTNGPAKDRALAFYSGAVGHMRSLNHTRDLVMHVRKQFDEHEALSVMNHVREMMTILATKLDEASTKTIKWGIK